MESNRKINNNDLEINLLDLFIQFKNFWYLIVIGILVGAVTFGAYSIHTIKPLYSASAKVYLRNAANTISLQELQMSQTLTKDYEIIFKRKPNLEKVIEQLSLSIRPEELSRMISINNPEDTRILEISIVTPDPTLSINVVNEFVDAGMETIREIDSQDPYVVERADKSYQINGSVHQNAIVKGAFMGIVLAMGAIVLRFLLSDVIQSVDDVERVLDLPVLALVLEDKSLEYKKNVILPKKKRARMWKIWKKK